MAKLLDVAVLNAMTTGAAMVSVSKGKISLSAEDSIEAIPHKDIISWSNTAGAAGTAQVVDVDFNGLSAAQTYSISVEHNDELRVYSATFSASTSDAAIVAALVSEFAKVAGAVQYTAAANGTKVKITMASAGVENGAMTVSAPITAGTNIVQTTPYVAPSGTVAEIAKLTPKTTIAGASYTKHSIIWNKLVSHNAVSGLKVYREVETVIYADENASGTPANFTAYEAEMDAKLGVTVGAGATNGLDTTSTATLGADLKEFLEK